MEAPLRRSGCVEAQAVIDRQDVRSQTTALNIALEGYCMVAAIGRR